MHRIAPFIILLFAYLSLSANLETANVVLGISVAIGILYLLRPHRRDIRWKRIPKAVVAIVFYLLTLLRDVTRSGIQMVRIVLHPDLPLRSGIIALPPECDSEVGRALGAHAISLPPGELLIAPYGPAFFDLLSTWFYFPFAVIPATRDLVIPPEAIPVALVVQALAWDFSTLFCGNFSNSVLVEITL